MNGYLRQSTASQARAIGPFVDDTDFKTEETGLTIANTDVKLRANGTTLSNKNSGGGTHQANGVYSLTWDATDTANVGELFFSVKVSGALQVFGTYVVLEEAAYDAMFAASAPGYVVDQPVNVTKWNGTAVATPATAGIPDVNVKNIDNDAASASGTVTFPNATLASTTNITAASGVALSSAGVQAIWDALTSALTTVGSIGKRLVDNLTGDIYARLGAPAGASVSADVAAVKALLPTALVGGRMDASVGAMASGVVTATAIGADAITAAKIADGAIDAATFAAGAINAAAIASDAITDAKVASDVTIASVTGAVGSVTGNVGGNVVGSVGSVTGLTAATVHSDLDDIQSRLPAALTSGGRMKASVEAILDTTFTEGAAGRIAAAFKQFFNIATPAATMDHGVLVDTVTTLTNAPSDSAGVTTLLSRLSALRAGYLDNLSAGAVALEASLQGLITTVGAAGAGLTATASAVWSVATRVLTAGTNIVLAKGTGITGFNDLSAAQVNTEADAALADVGLTSTITGRIDATISSRLASASYTAPLDAAGVRSAVGLASADLDTQLDGIQSTADAVETDTQDIQSRLPAALTGAGHIKADALVVSDKTGYALTSGERTSIANEVEAQIIDDTDSEKVLQAIVDKIAAANPSLDDLTLGAIASAVRTELATELARIDATISSRLATSGYTAPLSASGTRAALGLAAADLDTQLAALPTAAETAAAVRADLDSGDALPVNVKQINDVDLVGDGAATPWGPA